MKNQLFSLSRFYYYTRSQVLITWKYWVITLVSLFGLLVAVDMFVIQSGYTTYGDYFGEGLDFIWPPINKSEVLTTFYLGLFLLIIILQMTAFLPLRKKESTISYLTLPNSASERFVYELSRIYLPLLLYPIIFWLAFEMAMSIKVSFTGTRAWHLLDHARLLDLNNFHHTRVLSWASIVIGLLLVFSQVLFTGAVTFSAKYQVKAPAALALLLVFFFWLFYFIYGTLEYYQFIPSRKSITHYENLDSWKFYVPLALLITTVVKVGTFFKLKEREV